MRHSVLLEYDIGRSAWNALQKQDYISFAEWMVSKCASGNSKCTIEVSFPNGCSSIFSIDEFRGNFSSSSAYESIPIHISELDTQSFSCTFHPYKSARLVSVLGESITSVEAEDLAQDLKLAVERLYATHKVPSSLIVRSSPSAEEDVPAKVEITLSKTEHMRLDAKDAANSKWDKRRLAVEIVKDVSIAAVSALIAKFL